MSYVQGAGVQVDNPLKKALTQSYTWEDLSKQANDTLLKADSMGVKPDAQILANGGLTTNDYNNMVSGLKTPTTPNVDVPKVDTPLKDVVANTTPQAPSYTKAADNSGMINDSYSSLVSALRSQIEQAKNNKQLQINNLGQTYDPQRATSEVRKSNELRSVLEQSANAGDRGGVGRENALITQTEGDNRLNSINLQQTNDENSLKNDIANLILEGNIQEAQFQSQKLKDLIANNQYVDETNYNRSTNADNTAYSRGRDTKLDLINADNTAYSRGRDNLNDTRYTDETNYNRGRDNVNDTGKLADGTYTQAGALNQSNIAMNEIELKEKSDPNSITNQLARIGLDTAKLNLGALPQQIKDEALILGQNVQKGAIDIKVANAQLQELTNPNSITNQMAKIGLNTAKLNYAALPDQLKNEALVVAQQLQAGRIDIATAQKQLDNLKAGKTASGGVPTGTKSTTTKSTAMTEKQIADIKTKAVQMATVDGVFDPALADTILKYMMGSNNAYDNNMQTIDWNGYDNTSAEMSRLPNTNPGTVTGGKLPNAKPGASKPTGLSW